MSDKLDISNNKALNRFEYTEHDQAAFIDYRLTDKSIAFIHTFVPESMAGKGIAGALTVYAFQYAKENDLPVRVYCPYIEGYVKKHLELNSQLDKNFHSAPDVIESYDTLIDAITALKKQGYVEDFNLEQDCITCRDNAHRLKHNEFMIDKSFRFDVDEDPSDQSVVYAISSADHKLKGLLVNGYGIYSDNVSNEMIAKLK